MPKRPLLSFTYIALLLAAGPLGAGVELTAIEKDLPDGQPSTTRVQVDVDKIRIDARSGSDPQIVIFRGDLQKLWIADPQDQSYIEISQQQIQRMSDQIGSRMHEMQQRMQERLQNVPPEQRAMIEDMMKNRMGGASPGPAARTSYERVATAEKVHDWSCDKYVGTRNQLKTVEVWTTGWEQLGLSAADFQALQQMGRFFEGLSSRFSEPFLQVGSTDWEQQQGYPGIPLRRIEYQQGVAKRESSVQQVTKKSLAPELFELDPSWTKKDLPLPAAR
ncbi:MAG TPA: hypothetical protein VGB99_16130 [Acidobacteriota bacterium]